MTRIITVLGFLIDGLAAAGLVVASRVASERFATFREILDDIMASRAARVTFVLFWWWLGWHFLVVPPEGG